MLHLAASVFKLNEHAFVANLCCRDDDGNIDKAISNTLLELIHLAIPDIEFEGLVARAEAGQYTPPDPNYPDYGFNDVNLWLPSELTSQGWLEISNENTDQSDESNNRQRFSFREFWFAVQFNKRFLELINQHGISTFSGEVIHEPFTRDA